jgi:hypothetical protein
VSLCARVRFVCLCQHSSLSLTKRIHYKIQHYGPHFLFYEPIVPCDVCEIGRGLYICSFLINYHKHVKCSSINSSSRYCCACRDASVSIVCGVWSPRVFDTEPCGSDGGDQGYNSSMFARQYECARRVKCWRFCCFVNQVRRTSS